MDLYTVRSFAVSVVLPLYLSPYYASQAQLINWRHLGKPNLNDGIVR